jgi:hypothetical protein
VRTRVNMQITRFKGRQPGEPWEEFEYWDKYQKYQRQLRRRRQQQRRQQRQQQQQRQRQRQRQRPPYVRDGAIKSDMILFRYVSRQWSARVKFRPTKNGKSTQMWKVTVTCGSDSDSEVEYQYSRSDIVRANSLALGSREYAVFKKNNNAPAIRHLLFQKMTHFSPTHAVLFAKFLGHLIARG